MLDEVQKYYVNCYVCRGYKPLKTRWFRQPYGFSKDSLSYFDTVFALGIL